MTSRVGFRCDAGPSIGVGHVMRCLALAEELASREIEPIFFADVKSVPWAREQLAARGFAVNEPPSRAEEHVDQFTRCAVDAVVFDSYHLSADVYRAGREVGLTTMAIVDGPLQSAEADLFLDQNIGSEHDDVRLPEGSVRLAGLSYALLRDEVLAHRPSEPPTVNAVDAPRVLVVFGGTDAVGAGPVVLGVLAATRRPFHADVVTPSDELRAKAAAVELSDGQTVTTTGPTNRLAELVRAADLVVSAAGSSTWELLSLGACAALVCVADNQLTGYQRLVDAGLVVGLGSLRDLTDPEQSQTEVLSTLLTDHDRRQLLARAAWRSIDGRGRIRVADELLRICGARPSSPL